MRKLFACTIVGLMALASLVPAAVRAGASQGSFSEQRIRFARGAHSATLRGRVSQNRAILYKVGAKRGQTMTLMLDADSKTRFDLSGPKDSAGQTMVSDVGEDWSGVLPDDGDYKILVYTLDRGVSVPFTLSVKIE